MAGVRGQLCPRGEAHVTDAALGAGTLRAHMWLHSWHVRALLSDTRHKPNARVCHGQSLNYKYPAGENAKDALRHRTAQTQHEGTRKARTGANM